MIPIFEPSLTALEKEYLISAFDTGWISSQGEFLGEFEQNFAKFHGMKHAIASSNCTTALHLALLAAGVTQGSEVICPDLTFIAPANMIRLCGAVPVLVDIEPISWCIDPNKIEEKITNKTKAIIVVHAFGHAANMEKIVELSNHYGLALIEDVAEAPGAFFNSQLAGTFGDFSCYSFFANKIITTGEGGMILTNHSDHEKSIRILRDHGMSREVRYVHEVVGFNYRMTNMQAAIGLGQLTRFIDILEAREKQSNQYRNNFAGNSRIQWRPVEPWCNSVHWLATITLRSAELRNNLLAYLKNNKIDARQMVYPVHMAKPYQSSNKNSDFPISNDISLKSLHLPSSTNLTENQVDYICSIVSSWININDPM